MTTLIGTNPDQIPVNSMLGGMAYQDPDSINVKDFKYSGTLSGLGNSSIVSTSGDVLSTVHANNATGGAIAILKAGDGTSSSYYSYLRIINNDSSPKTWDIGTRGNDNLHIYDGTNTRVMVSSGTDHVQFNSGNTSFFIGNGATAGGGTTDDTSFNWSLGGAVKLCRNSTLVAEIDSSNNLIMKTTGALKVSEGTTAQRPASPQEGMIRKNSTLGVIEGYSGGDYVSLEAGRLIARTVYSAPGSYTWTPSAKTKYAILILISGGGGSGGCPPTTASQASISVPGSPGQFVRCEIPRGVSLGGSYSVTVGAGGAGGTGSASPTNGVNGGVTIVQNNTDSSFISITGGWSGAAGYATTVFPETVSNVGPNSINNSGGHFAVLERNHTIFVQGVLFGTNGNNWNDNPSIAPCVAANPKSGVAGLSRILAASSAAANGNSGGNGEVIIYEYS